VLNATRELILPTTITGSYPRPQWFTEELRGRGFKDALGDSRFDLTVGGKSWFF
jgi:5-methyltetrahydropteroyltriglutamate--homocysteine methyltransferase